MKRFAARTPPHRPSFIWVGGQLYLDVLANFGHDLDVDFADLQRFLIAVPPGALLLARKLTPAELRMVLRDLDDAHADIYGRLVPNDQARLQPPKARR